MALGVEGVFQWYCHFFYIVDRPYDPLENASYTALHRVSFSLGVAWIVLTYYTTGYGKLVRQSIFICIYDVKLYFFLLSVAIAS